MTVNLTEQQEKRIKSYDLWDGTLGDCIGRGGFSKVFELKNPDGTTDAVKLITITYDAEQAKPNESKADYLLRVYRESLGEVQNMMLLRHLKHFISFYDYEEHTVRINGKREGYDILIRMEKQTPLDRYVKQNSYDERFLIRLGIEICTALIEAAGYYKKDNKEFIHRDIKPANIFVTNDGTFKLGDLGVASVSAHTAYTRIGTQGFVATEILLGKGCHANADLFSLGRTLQVLSEGMTLTSGLKRVIDLAEKDDPKERYQTAQDMRADLEKCLKRFADHCTVFVPEYTMPIETQNVKETQKVQSERETVKLQAQEIEQLRKQLAELRSAQQTSAPQTDIEEIVPPEPEHQEAKSVPTPKKRHTLKAKAKFCSDKKRDTVTKIVFETFLTNRTRSVRDVSAARDRSILSWVDAENVLHIGSEGIICANPDSSSMFEAYHQVKTIDFGTDFDTSSVTNMSFMFCRCKSLQALDVSGFDTSRVTDMSYMFSDCTSLQALDVSSFDTSRVTDMSNMFSDCTSLQALDVSSFDTSSVTDMGMMFSDCTKLQALDVSGFDTSCVANMSSMFFSCERLEALDVSGFDTSRVTDMNEMFSNCENLKELHVSRFETGSVTDMRWMFFNCRALSEDSKARIKALGIPLE